MRSKKRGKSKCFILGFPLSVVRYGPHAEARRARRGILGQFITKTGFCWILLVWVTLAWCLTAGDGSCGWKAAVP